MKKRFKILLAIILPIMCITSLCMSFLMISNDNKTEKVEEEKVSVNKTRYEANYFAMADETSPAQGQNISYKGGAVFLEPDSTFIMIGGTIQNHTNTYGGAVFISEGATFTMTGGTITGCSSTYGGAIYVSAGGTCNINAGTITSNTANYGPSIYAEEGAIVNISADTVIDENSVELNKKVSISTDTIPVGHLSANVNMHYVDFGSYPQWYVGNDMNATLESWHNSNSPTAVNTYVVRQRTWEAYEYTDGNIYARGLSLPYSTSFTYLNGETVIASGSAVWFKVEPIRWIILNYDEYVNGSTDNIEVVSNLALTADIYFHDTQTFNLLWDVSFVREWLNNIFYNSAFTEEEKEIIAESTTSLGTQDNIYLLTHDRYNSLGRALCSPTDFALSNNSSETIYYPTGTHSNGGTCDYFTIDVMYYMTAHDGLYEINHYGVNDGSICVRPALQLAL
ncbi:MAG: hypothetical protein IKC11_03560 [Clostridia bacterium]|nr:hypothetical protein [Clostridia bacterium]